MSSKQTEAARILQLASDHPELLDEPVEMVEQPEPTAADRFRDSFITGPALWEIPPPTWLVRDLLVQKSVAMLYGPSMSGKSFVAVEMAGAIITGQDCLGIAHDTTGSVVYLAGEGGEETAKRMLGWCQHHKVNPAVVAERFHLRAMGGRLHEPGWVEPHGVVDSISALAPSLVVIDTLHTYLLGASDSEDKPVGEAIQVCVQIAQATGACVLFIHHPKKDGSDFRGSGALWNDADTVLELNGNTTTNSTLTPRKQKGSGLAASTTVGFTWHQGVHPVTGAEYDTLVAQPTTQPVKVSSSDQDQQDCIYALGRIATPGQWVNSKRWAQAVQDFCSWKKQPLKASGYPSSEMAEAIRLLVESGRVLMAGSSSATRYSLPTPPEQLTI